MRLSRADRSRLHRWALRAALLAVGLVVLAPLVSVDPGALALLLDVDLVLLLGTVGVGLLAADVRMMSWRVARSLPVLWLRVGVDLTRESPRTLAA